MDGFEEDPFGGAAPLGEAPVEAAPAIDLSEFDAEVVSTVPDLGPGAPPEPSAADHAAHDVVILSTAESQAAFIGGYVPHPVDLPPAIPPSPSADDPRIAWRKKNQELLAAKDKEEATAKKCANERAKAHVTKFNEDRTKKLDQKKKANRQAETASPESGVPKGTTWEKVNLLINFARQDKVHTKDLSRFKAVLGTAKALNVPVAAK